MAVRRRAPRGQPTAGHHSETLDRLNALDLCFVVDATGSMVPWIKQVRLVLTEVVHTVAASPSRPDLRLALVEYRDHSQAPWRRRKAETPPATSGGFVGEVAAFDRQLRNVRCSGGWDGPEAVPDGIDAALRLPWRQFAQKVCVLIGDAPPHGMGAPGDSFPKGCPCGLSVDAVVRRGAATGIVVHGVAVTGDAFAQRAMRAAADAGGGEFFTLTDATGLARVLTEVAVVETGKVAMDLDVAARYDAAAGDLGRIARESGRSEADVRASVERLRAKAAIDPVAGTGRGHPGDAPVPGRASRVRFRP